MSAVLPLAISMGDPSGIGPEIVVKALAGGRQRCVVLGSLDVIRAAAKRLRSPMRFAFPSVRRCNFICTAPMSCIRFGFPPWAARST